MARQTPLTCSGHTRPVVDLAFSDETEDGFFLISACKDGKPMMRDGKTGDWIGTFEGHKGAVWCARLNDGATKAITGSADFNAKLWDAITGNELLTFPHKHIVRTVDFSKTDGGSRILTGGSEKILRVFDVTKPDAALVSLEGHSKAVKVGLFVANDTQILSCAEDKTIRIWDIKSGSTIKTITLDDNPTSAEFSKNGKYLTTTHGKTATFWDAKTFEKIKEFTAETQLCSACIHPDNTKFVAGGSDFYLHVCDFETMKEVDVFKGHHGPVWCVRYSPDGEVFASGSEDGTVRLWQTNVGTEYGLWQYSKPSVAASTES